MSKELKLLKNDNSHYYNADGIIKNTKNHLEMGILETTGPLLITNDQKETNDNIKAGFGLVAMLHTIGREFFYGDFSSKKLEFFIQAIRMYLFLNLKIKHAYQNFR